MNDKLAYSVKEAAEALCISQWQVREEVHRGRIRAKKVGTRVIIPRWAIEEWLKPEDSHNGTHWVAQSG